MRVLLASYFVLPNAGGLWTYVDQLKRGFERLGHEVDLIAHHPDFLHYHMPEKGLTFDKEKVRPLIEEVVDDYFAQQHLAVEEAVRELEVERYILEAALAYFGLKKYDVIHAQDILSTRAAARVKAHRTPLVATIHGCLALEELQHGVVTSRDSLHFEYLGAHEYFGMMSADMVIVPSQWIKDLFVQEFRVPKKQIQVVMNGMDVDLFAKRMYERSGVECPDGKRVIACNARLDRIKGHVHLFDALVQLKKVRTDWVCWLIGDGDQREELEALCKQLELEEQVQFLGTRSDVPALLKAADICVLPSLQENCPFAVMEAQVAGCPIIASEVGGIPEMIEHEKTGLLTGVGHSESLFQHLQRMLEEDQLRHTLGKNAKKWGRVQWSLDTMQAQTLEIYERVLRQKR